ncbi:MAG: glutamate synthase subunit beta, partial [Cyclobacteriaceae bacterium]|nr:glutamate synthase subunit beta [Cyclobacteriaceae bacterium]
EHIEKTIAEKAYDYGYMIPKPPESRTGKRIAIIGSGPAGLAAADQLNKAGHLVTVYERSARPGGLLTYGIPDFKLEKWVVERRVNLMKEEGVVFKMNTNVGVDISTDQIMEENDAVVLCGGSTIPRDLPIPGRELKGIHYAMEFLTQQNKRVAGEVFEEENIIAKDKHVLVIGGGDTGSDCVGTSNRHGAISVTQLELLERPAEKRMENNPWPEWPLILRTSSSHEEGCDRKWAVLSENFVGDNNGNVKALKIADIEWFVNKEGKSGFKKIEGSERELPCDLVFLAMGFVHPQRAGMLEQLAVNLDDRGNVKADKYQTNVEKVFVAGDMHRGQSLVVWAISEGREAARKVDIFLSGEASVLKSKNQAVTILD